MRIQAVRSLPYVGYVPGSARNVLRLCPERSQRSHMNPFQRMVQSFQTRRPLFMTFYNQSVDKKGLKKILSWYLENYGPTRTSELLDFFKKIGFQYATTAGLSLGFDDLRIPLTKSTLLETAQEQVQKCEKAYLRGSITAFERYQKLIDIWTTTSEILKEEVVANFQKTPLNPLFMMAFSGARGNISQVRQLVGMRGLMSDSGGGIIDFPIRRNFREGLSVTEYVISCYGARKGLIDTALRTADSGYLTRRLVDVAHGIIIRQIDCFTKASITVPLSEKALVGRVLAETLLDPFHLEKPKSFVWRNQDISPSLASEIVARFSLAVDLPHSSKKTKSETEDGTGSSARSPDATLQASGYVPASPEPRSPTNPGVRSAVDALKQESPKRMTHLHRTELRVRSPLTCDGTRQKRVATSEAYRSPDATFRALPGVRSSVDAFGSSPPPTLGFRNVGQTNASTLLSASRAGGMQNQKKAASSERIKAFSVSHFEGICQLCYGWNLAQGRFVSIGDAVGVLAAQSIGEPGTQLTMRTFHTGGVFSTDVQDKIFAPHDGTLSLIRKQKGQKSAPAGNPIFNRPTTELNGGEKTPLLLGCKIRSIHGETGFLTFEPLQIQIQKNEKVSRMHLPQQSVLYVFPGKEVRKNALCAEISRVLPPSSESFESAAGEEPDENKTMTVLPVQSSKPSTVQKRRNQKWRNVLSEIEGQVILPFTRLHPEAVQHDSVLAQGHSQERFFPARQKAAEVWVLSGTKIQKFFSKTNKKPFSFEDGDILGSLCRKSRRNLGLPRTAALQASSAFRSSSRMGSESTTPSCAREIRQGVLLSFEQQKKVVESESSDKGNILNGNQNPRKPSLLANRNRRDQPLGRLSTLEPSDKSEAASSRTKPDDLSPIVFQQKKLGQLFKNGNLIEYTGQIIRKNFLGRHDGKRAKEDCDPRLEKEVFLLRRVQPHLFPQSVSLSGKQKMHPSDFIGHGKMVQEREKIFQIPLPESESKTGDIVQGLPKIDQLFEGRGTSFSEEDPTKGLDRMEPSQNRHGLKSNGKSVGRLSILQNDTQHLNQRTFSAVPYTHLPSKYRMFDESNEFGEPSLPDHSVLSQAVFSGGYHPAIKRFILQLRLVDEIQSVYQSQGVEIADKHVEIIVRQMTSKVKIIEKGETPFFPDDIVDFERLQEMSPEHIFYEPILLGITKVSFFTESFISAASFQETKRVLMQSAIQTRVDFLSGLKENVIVGRLIPAGTGIRSPV